MLVLSMGLSACATTDQRLVDAFRNPAMSSRPNLNLHGLPDSVPAQDTIIANYLAEGYGGMASNTNWTDGYLKDEREMKVFFDFAGRARAEGMNVWLYDENWYPSGMAGGYILEEHPEWEAEGLLFKDSVVTGSGQIRLPVLPGKLMTFKAIPVVQGYGDVAQAIDVRGYVSSDTLQWNMPNGTWRFVQVATSVLREGFQAGTDRGGKERYYPSLLMPEVCERFISLTHKRYAGVLGDKLGTLFYATFTDEPSSMAHTFENRGFGVYPWKQVVSDTLQARFHWRLEDNLMDILVDTTGRGQRLRYEYFSVIRDLMRDNYFKAIRDYCASQGIKSSGHLLLEESLPIQVLLYGDIMACFREMDIPGIDVLTAMPDFTDRYLISARLAASVAELNGGTEVMSEICPVADPPFRGGKEASTLEAKGTVNRQLVGGVTRFNNYLRLEHATRDEKYAFNTYVARLSTLLNRGHRASNIAVLYPIETLWTKSRPVPAWNKSWDDMAGGAPELMRSASVFDNISAHLYAHQWEFSYLDVTGLMACTVSDGTLRHGSLSWDVLVLPQVQTLSLEALQVIDRFVQSGGKVIAVGGLPENSGVDFPSDAVMQLSASVFSGSANRAGETSAMQQYEEAPFEAMLSSMTARKYEVLPAGLPIRCSHKQVDGSDMLFVTNDSNQSQTFSVRFAQRGAVSLWDPNTGKVEKNAEQQAKLTLAPYDAVMLIKGNGTKR